MSYWYHSDDDYEEIENTPEELDIIDEHIDNMIDYVANQYLRNRIYQYYDTYTRIYMFNYYKNKLQIILSTNTIINLMHQYESVIQERVNLSPESIKQYQYETYIKYVRKYILGKANNKTRIGFDRIFTNIPRPDDEFIKVRKIKDEDKRRLYDEYLQQYNDKHPREPKPVKTSFNDELDK